MRQADLNKLNNAHKLLYDVIVETDKVMPIRVLSTYRTPKEQFELYKKGRKITEDGNWIVSDKKIIVTGKDGYQNMSKHNYFPSQAVDVAPDPINWNDIVAFERMCNIIKSIADARGVKIRQGRDWKDYPHQEIIT